MTVYIVLVTSIHGGVASIDVFESYNDAHARLKRAQANFPYHDGWTVALLEKHVSPDLSTVLSS
jgi:transcription elongation factor GreA-like protein